jgi:hypothetical protein
MEVPPFDVDQEIDDIEISDILENGAPSTWLENVVIQGFDHMEHTAS